MTTCDSADRQRILLTDAIKLASPRFKLYKVSKNITVCFLEKKKPKPTLNSYLNVTI